MYFLSSSGEYNISTFLKRRYTFWYTWFTWFTYMHWFFYWDRNASVTCSGSISLLWGDNMVRRRHRCGPRNESTAYSIYYRMGFAKTSTRTTSLPLRPPAEEFRRPSPAGQASCRCGQRAAAVLRLYPAGPVTCPLCHCSRVRPMFQALPGNVNLANYGSMFYCICT